MALSKFPTHSLFWSQAAGFFEIRCEIASDNMYNKWRLGVGHRHRHWAPGAYPHGCHVRGRILLCKEAGQAGCAGELIGLVCRDLSPIVCSPVHMSRVDIYQASRYTIADTHIVAQLFNSFNSVTMTTTTVRRAPHRSCTFLFSSSCELAACIPPPGHHRRTRLPQTILQEDFKYFLK